ncbi:MAG: hypothetical protein FWG73_08995 [Planctomycetaceae bacterium]|nr:hypothetical protein [Planctomycetaceae bacterium]
MSQRCPAFFGFAFLLVSIIAVLTTVCIANDNAKALALLKGVEKERLQYDSFHIRYEEHRPAEEQTIEQIVDFDKGKIRKNHFFNDSPSGKRSILLEDKMYSMTSHDDRHVAIVEHQSNNAYAAEIYDPRILGLADMMNHRIDVRDCLLYTGRSNFSVSRENLDGRPVFVVECRDGADNGFAHFKLYIEEPGFRLIKKTVESEFGSVYISNDYSERKFLPFPTKTRIYRTDADGNVVFDQHFTVKEFQTKRSFPPETFTLAGLNPPLNSDIVDYRSSRRLGYWDGEKIVDNPVEISAQELRELMRSPQRGPVQYLGIGIGGAMILLGLYLFLRRRLGV